jgi:murein DD-endopeptidase MepM/ murein hydrolase activator NlpD
VYNKKYGLKLRNSKMKNSGIHTRSMRDRAVNSAIVCILILVSVMTMKIARRPFTNSILETFAQLVQEQTDFADTADSVMSFFTDTVSTITGKDISMAASDTLAIKPPLKEGKMKQGFETTEHPVFQTNIAPTGIEVQATAGAYVYSPGEGKCEHVIEGSDGTKRLVVSLKKNVRVIYDNLQVVYVEAGESVTEDQTIGALPDGNSILGFEVWVDNEAKNPIDFIGEIYY